jgi:excinuclease ABC subunit B
MQGKAILYADRVTDSMVRAIGETDRRRERQTAHNTRLGITPQAIVKKVRDLIDGVYSEKAGKEAQRLEQQAQLQAQLEDWSEKDLAREIKRLEKHMLDCARNLEFEQAARARDQLKTLKTRVFGVKTH